MARFVALAVLLAIAAGVYGFIQRSNVTAAQMRIAETQKELETWKVRTAQYQSESKSAAAGLEACNAQVNQVQAALDAALEAQKKPAGRR
jgi:Tfp pilus assembly protein PilE